MQMCTQSLPAGLGIIGVPGGPPPPGGPWNYSFTLHKIHSCTDELQLVEQIYRTAAIQTYNTYHITSWRCRGVGGLRKQREIMKEKKYSVELSVAFLSYSPYRIGVWRVWPGSAPTRSPGTQTHRLQSFLPLASLSLFQFICVELATTKSPIARVRRWERQHQQKHIQQNKIQESSRSLWTKSKSWSYNYLSLLWILQRLFVKVTQVRTQHSPPPPMICVFPT